MNPAPLPKACVLNVYANPAEGSLLEKAPMVEAMIRQTSMARRIPNGSAKPILAAAGGVLKATLVAGPMNAIARTAAPSAPMAPPLRRPGRTSPPAFGVVEVSWLMPVSLCSFGARRNWGFLATAPAVRRWPRLPGPLGLTSRSR